MAYEESGSTEESASLTKYLSGVDIWALSLGCAVGWGAFVMPATTLLPQAGPVGTIVAMVIAAAIISIIAVSFGFMMNRHPDSGGAFAFVRETIGHDHAFLAAWALVLAYISIMWANATAFVLISRFLLGPVFQVGFHYTVAGYDVYFGEICLTIGVFLVFGLFSCLNKRVVKTVNTVLAFVMLIGTVVCFFAVLSHSGGNPASFNPPFAGDRPPFLEVFGIVMLAPWAFLGFESVSNAAGEISFSPKKVLPIMILGIVAGMVIYILTTAISVIGMPAGYDSWSEYVADLGNLDGLAGLPTYYAIQQAWGIPGLAFLAIVVVSAMSTSLLGLFRASSRLFYSLARERILPPWFGKVNHDGVPRNAILFIMLISFIVPFVGRAAIGWIVDVTSVSAAIVYMYASVCSLKVAREESNTSMKVASGIGIFASVIFAFLPLLPNAWSVNALASESYLILAVWAMIGLVLFRIVFKRDSENRFGHSTIVWVLMVFIILFSSSMWMRQITFEQTEASVAEIAAFYDEEGQASGIVLDEATALQNDEFMAGRADDILNALMSGSVLQVVLIVFSLAIMFNIYALMRKREHDLDEQRLAAEETSKAKTVFLSNMSHDIRTPMNAIIGYTHLARKEGTSVEEMREYLDKIDGSSKHLLALINDVLEMSRIESGKVELDIIESDIVATMNDVRDMFATQMREKGITYTVDAHDVRNRHVLCDPNRMNRVLLNLISNAYKFTPEDGSVSVSLAQVGEVQDGRASFELRVRDTGIGMTPEFAERVFEAFERERTSTVSGIQGTGLGMAITKSIVDMMGGDIRVITAPGEGTEFVIALSFEVVDVNEDAAAASDEPAQAADEIDFSGKRILLVEDNEINREIATLILEDAGFVIESAENGKVGYDMVAASQPGYYDVVLMDVQMPVMNGYESTRAIRSLDDPGLAAVPIIAASANAFAEDVQAAREAGMNGHVAKPLDVAKVLQVLSEILG